MYLGLMHDPAIRQNKTRGESMKRIPAIVMLATFVPLLAGCQQLVTDPVATPGKFLEEIAALFALGKEPVRIGITREDITWIGAPPWDALQQTLTHELGRPVHFMQLRPFQVRLQMDFNRLDFAMVSTGALVSQFANSDVAEVIACPISADHGSTRQGVILASAKSELKSVADLKGQRFAFGPRGDAVLHLAAMRALQDAGVGPDDIKKELLPVPGALQHHLSGQEAAKAAVYEEGTAACVVEEHEYEKWPETGGKLLTGKVSKDQVRVIGHTPEVPEGAILASKKADPALVDQVKAFLLERVAQKTEIVARMDLTGFEPADTNTFGPALQMASLAGTAPDEAKGEEDLNYDEAGPLGVPSP
jgi:ABC-type phosphate/phosphonate transport system substrate-binding protein